MNDQANDQAVTRLVPAERVLRGADEVRLIAALGRAFGSDVLVVGPTGEMADLSSLAAALGEPGGLTLVRDLWDDVHPADRSALQDYLQSIRAGTPGPDGLAIRLRRSGRPTMLSFSGFALPASGPPGRPAEVDSAVVLIADRSDGSEGYAGSSLAQAGHELRAPLTAILGFGRLLEADPVANDPKEAAHFIVQAGEHLLAIIEGLTRQGSSTRTSLNPPAVDAMDAFVQAAEMLRPMARERGVIIEHSRGSVQATSTDPLLTRQIAINLISNAVKFNRRGGRVDIWSEAVGEHRLRVFVRDEGLGIEEAQLERLFVPYERFDAEQRGIEGAGVGLAVSARLAQKIGGSLGAASTAGFGATFWLELPLLSSEAANACA